MTVTDTVIPRQRRSSTTAVVPQDEVLEALRRGDEDQFLTLVRTWTPMMVSLAQARVPSRAIAEEVVQDTWIGVLEGIGRFEGRSSLRTWVFRILLNKAHTRGAAERRMS